MFHWLEANDVQHRNDLCALNLPHFSSTLILSTPVGLQHLHEVSKNGAWKTETAPESQVPPQLVFSTSSSDTQPSMFSLTIWLLAMQPPFVPPEYANNVAVNEFYECFV
jgi:hypothetical protein